MTDTLVTIEDQQLVTATGGAKRPVSFIEPDLRQAGFTGKELNRILKLPFGEQARILNRRIRNNGAQ